MKKWALAIYLVIQTETMFPQPSLQPDVALPTGRANREEMTRAAFRKTPPRLPPGADAIVTNKAALGPRGAPAQGTARTGHTWQDPGTSERAASTWLLSRTETRSSSWALSQLSNMHATSTLTGRCQRMTATSDCEPTAGPDPIFQEKMET